MTVQTEPVSARLNGVSETHPATPPIAPPRAQAPDETPHAEVAPAPARGRRLNLRRLILPVGGILLVVAAFVGVSMYREGQLYISTENAQLTGTPVQIGAKSCIADFIYPPFLLV